MKYILILLLLISLPAFADDDQLYCDFIQEKAQADRLQLVSPSAIAGLGHNASTATNVIGVGVTESLSHYLKGNAVGELGDAECKLYRSMNEITKHTTYDIIVLNNTVAQHKVEVVTDAIKQLDSLLARENDLLSHGESTVFMVSMIEAAQAKMLTEQAVAQEQLETTQPPEFQTQKPLVSLLAQAKEQLIAQQQLSVKSSKYDNWDVSVAVGAGTNPANNSSTGSSISVSGVKPYVSLNGSYSFGAIARDHALQRSADAYIEWNNSQAIGPIQLAYQLQHKVEKVLVANTAGLLNAIDYHDKIKATIERIDRINTVEAHRFQVQLDIESVINNVNVEQFTYTTVVMKNYLARNFTG